MRREAGLAVATAQLANIEAGTRAEVDRAAQSRSRQRRGQSDAGATDL